jgi:hypothetical protein
MGRAPSHTPRLVALIPPRLAATSNDLRHVLGVQKWHEVFRML